MKRTKKEIAVYNAAATKIVVALGGSIMPSDSSYNLQIPTKAGDLLVSIDSDCCYICTRFEDVEAAKELGLGERLNEFSGKWNWMGGMDHQGDMLDLAYFQQALRKIV